MDRGELTQMFNESAAASEVMGQAFEAVYQELRALAAYMLGPDRDQTLSPTIVVHEVYEKLVDASELSVSGRQHFFALCSRVMRQVITDHARRMLAAKRGGGKQAIDIDSVMLTDRASPESVLALDEAFQWLERRDSRLTELLQLRIYAGLELKEIAPLMDVSLRQLQRDWKRARAWLSEALVEFEA